MNGLTLDASAALASVSASVCVLDRDVRIVYLNPACKAMLGYGALDGVGDDFHATHRATDAHGQARAREDCAIARAASRGMGHDAPTAEIWRKDGVLLTAAATAVPLLVDGLLQGAVVTLRDLSAERRAEDRRQTALDELRATLAETEAERDYLRAEAALADEWDPSLAHSPASDRLTERLEAAALSSASVLLHGEPGTERLALARYLHARSHRQDRPFVVLRCSPDGMALAGSEPGAGRLAPDAEQAVHLVRAFRLADGGSLVVDRVDEAPRSTQALMLRALEQGIGRSDGGGAGDVDARLIATTGPYAEGGVSGLDKALEYRLGVLTIGIAALRERREDIGVIAQREFDRLSAVLGRPSRPLGVREIRSLAARDWPGNVFEMRAELALAMLPGATSRSRYDHIDAEQQAGQHSLTVRSERDMRAAERANTLAALRACDGRVSGPNGAAKLLGIKASTLTYRIKAFAIEAAEYN